jgi:tetratricopeptide (TPR) repeat protein
MATFRFLNATIFGAAVLVFSGPSAAIETVAQAIRHTAKEAAEATPEDNTVETNSPSETRLEDVKKAIDAEDYQKAITLSSELLNREPRNAGLLAFRGRARLYLNQEDEAKPDLEEALHVDPKNLDAMYGLGYYYVDKCPKRAMKYANDILAIDAHYEIALRLRCCLYFQRKEWEKARADCEQLLVLQPREAEYYFYRSVIHHYCEEHGLALMDLDKAIELAPNYMRYQLRATCLARQGEMEKAIADYRQFKQLQQEDVFGKQATRKRWGLAAEGEDAICLANLALIDDPDNAETLLNRAAAEFELGQIDAALADATRAQELRPELVGAYVVRAQIFAYRNDLPAASAEVEQGLQAIPNDPYLLVGRANLRKDQGDGELAKIDMEYAVRADPKHAAWYVLWGDELASQNKFDEALKIYNRVLELAPQCPEALNRRGRIRYERKQWAAAAADFQMQAAIQPNSTEPPWVLFYVYWQQKKEKEMLDSLNQVLDIDPEYIQALMCRAQYLADHDRNTEALPDAKEYVRLKPYDDQGILGRGRIYFNLLEWSPAFADFDEAVRLNPQNARNFFVRGFAKYRYYSWLSMIAYRQPSTDESSHATVTYPQTVPQTYELSLPKDFGNNVPIFQTPKPRVVSGEDTDTSIFSSLHYNPKYDSPLAKFGSLDNVNQAVQKNLREALADMTEAVRLEPDNVLYHESRLRICTELKDDDAALPSLDALIRLNPNAIDAYLQRGLARTQKKQYDEALADFTKVIELDPENRMVYFYRAGLYDSKGEAEKAKIDFAKAREFLQKH